MGRRPPGAASVGRARRARGRRDPPCLLLHCFPFSEWRVPIMLAGHPAVTPLRQPSAAPRSGRRAPGVLGASVLSLCLLTAGCSPWIPFRDAEPTPPPPRPLVIDGEFFDWWDRGSMWLDMPRGGGGARPVVDGTAPGIRTDMSAHDAEGVYFLLNLDRAINLQSFEGTLRLLLNADGDPGTGMGVEGFVGADWIVDFSHRPGADGVPGQGVRVRRWGVDGWEDSRALSVRFAPTHASRSFEIGISRLGPEGSPGPFPPPVVAELGLLVRARFLSLDPSGRVLDSTGTLRQRLRGEEGLRAPPPSAEAVARRPGTDLRVVQWSVGGEPWLSGPGPFLRILAALAPDVILLDDVDPDLDADRLQGALGALPDGAAWSVVVGSGGGPRRTAVASRLPLAAESRLARVEWPDSVRALDGLPMGDPLRSDLAGAALDGIPAVGARVSLAGRSLLVVPVGLVCCGRAGSPEDRARIMAAGAIRDAVEGVLRGGEVDGLLVGGNLNLVGSPLPLEILARGLDPAGQDLAVAPAPQLGGRSNATWNSPGPFPPGRLDHLLFSRSLLQLRGSFAFDPGALTMEGRKALGLEEGDGEASEHLPVVADLGVSAK